MLRKAGLFMCKLLILMSLPLGLWAAELSSNPSSLWQIVQVWQEPVDAMHDWSVKDVAALPSSQWRPIRHANEHFGSGRGTLWARFKLNNDSADSLRRVIVHEQSFVDRVDLFIREQGGEWRMLENLRDDSSPYWFGASRDPAFIVDWMPNTKYEFLLRVQTFSLRRVPLQLYLPADYARYERRVAMVSGLFVAIPLIVGVFLIMLWRMLASPGLLVVTGLILSEVIGAYWVGGVFYSVTPWVSKRLMGVIGMGSWVLAMCFAFQHVRLFLELPKVLPRVARLFQILPFVLVGLAGFEVMGVPAGRNLIIIISFLAMCSFLSLSLWRSAQGQAYAWVYAMAWGTYAVSIGLTMLNLAGLVPPNVANMMMFAQGSIVSLLFGFAVIGQVRDREKKTQAALVELQARQAKQELVEARNLARKATEDRMRLFAAANHDLRQPLQSLGLYLELLRIKVSDPEAAGLLNNMRASHLSLADFMDSLSALSRLEAKAIPVKWADFELNALLVQLESEYGAAAAQKGLDFRLVETTAWVRSDRRLLERILRNLLSNAVKYTDQGRIIFGVRRRAGQQLDIQVVDSGLGIPLDQQKLIFDEFAQLHVEADAVQGSGLGLSIVRGLSDVLGHELSLRSEAQRGSCFSLKLHQAEPQGELNADASAMPCLPQGLSILVVDDEREVRLSFAQYLMAQGAEVASADSTSTALSAVADWRPDLLILDFRLGAENGLDCLRHLRERLKDQVPAIIVTGDTAPERLAQLQQSDVPVLHKPVSPARLVQKIVELCPNES